MSRYHFKGCVKRCRALLYRCFSFFLTLCLLFLVKSSAISRDAELARRRQAGELARQALRALSDAHDPVASGELSLASLALWPTRDGDHALRQALNALCPVPGAEQHTGAVYAVAIAPDGRWAASASSDHTVRVWSIVSGGPCGIPHLRAAARLQHDHWVTDVAISPDGRWLASASLDGQVRVWRVDGSDPQILALATSLSHSGQALCVAFGPDSRWLASGSTDCTAILLHLSEDGTEWKKVATLPHDIWVETVRFAPAGEWLATISGGIVRLWLLYDIMHSPGSFMPFWATDAHRLLWKLAFSIDGSFFIAGSLRGEVYRWRREGTSWYALDGLRSSGLLSSIAISTQGKAVAVGHLAGDVWLWPQADEGTTYVSISFPDASLVRQILFDPDNLFLLVSAGKSVHIWGYLPRVRHGEALEELAVLNAPSPVISMALGGKEHLLMTGHQDGSVRLWLWRTCDLEHVLCTALRNRLALGVDLF